MSITKEMILNLITNEFGVERFVIVTGITFAGAALSCVASVYLTKSMKKEN